MSASTQLTNPRPTVEPTRFPRALVIAVGAFLVAHGAAHLPGALDMWGLRHDDPALAVETAISYEGAGAALMGVAWCLGLVAMVVAGGLVLARHRWAARVLTGATGLSLVICIAGLPTAFVGVLIDAAILAVLAALRGRRTQ